MRRISTSLVAAGFAAALLATGEVTGADDAAGRAERDDSNPPMQTVRVVSVQPDGMKIVGHDTNGKRKTIQLSSATAIERHGPGDASQAARGPMKLGDITPGDRILVDGEPKGDVVSAKRIQVIGPASADGGTREPRSGADGAPDEGRTGRGSGIGSGPGPGTPESGSGTN